MPQIFSDNMMLQRNKDVKVWGWALPNAKVDVEFENQKIETIADKTGNWTVVLKKMKANATPAIMKISENSKVQKEIKNILVGEVWIAGGQSNMEWTTASTDTAEDVKKNANYPTIRYFKPRCDIASLTPQKDTVNGRWIVCTPNQAMGFSAVAFYFAEVLNKELNIPVGIVYTALGATPMHNWLPKEKFANHKGLETDWAIYQKRIANYDYTKTHARWVEESEKYKAARNKSIAQKTPRPYPSHFVQNEPIPEDPDGPRQLPTGGYCTKIAPIAGFTAQGFIWYQGEADAHTHRVAHFQENFTLLIKTWRELWHDNSMQFYFVQLTAHYRPHDWPSARWAQFKVSKEVPNTAMAVSIDLGKEKEIHPPKKQPIGQRLANIALSKIYKKDVVYPYSPSFEKVELIGSNAKIFFKTGGRALECKENPRGFEVLLSDGKWHQAKANFKKSFVEVASEDGKEIKAVRYLWKSWCGDDVCIFNQDGLPAMPFTSQEK